MPKVMRVIAMTKKLFITFIVMFVLLTGLIGIMLIKDSGKDISKDTSVIENTP